MGTVRPPMDSFVTACEGDIGPSLLQNAAPSTMWGGISPCGSQQGSEATLEGADGGGWNKRSGVGLECGWGAGVGSCDTGHHEGFCNPLKTALCWGFKGFLWHKTPPFFINNPHGDKCFDL